MIVVCWQRHVFKHAGEINYAYTDIHTNTLLERGETFDLVIVGEARQERANREQRAQYEQACHCPVAIYKDYTSKIPAQL